MNKKIFLRRGSEVLAAVVIVISIVLYTFTTITDTGINPVSLDSPDSSGEVSTESGTENQAAAGTYLNGVQTEKEQSNAVKASETDTVTSVAATNDIAGDASTPSDQEVADSSALDANNGTADASGMNTNPSVQVAENTGVPSDTKVLAAEKPEEPVYRYVQIDELNIRTGPDGEDEKIGALKKGSRVQVLQQQDKWLEIITADNLKGFIFAEYTADTVPPVYKYVASDSLNVRSGASSETEKLGTLAKGARVQVLEKNDEWIEIITTESVKGYVWAEYVSDEAPVVYNYVNLSALNVRKGPGSDTKKLTELKSGDRVQLLENQGDWSRIKTKDNVEGYVYSKYVVKNHKQVSRSESGSASYDGDLASQVMEYAKSFLGVKYVYGGESPKGFDCSGFTQYVYGHFKIKLPRSAAEYEDAGTKISRNDLKPGDIILFDRYDDWRLGHVGIYLGNDYFIHASSSKGKVVTNTLTKYGGNILGLRRVLK